MSDMLHYGDECELILHLMKEQGVSFVGLSYAGDWMGNWPQYWDKDAYYSHSCEDMSIEKIAWLFSGESNNGQEGIQQSWKKLNKLINSSGYSIKVNRP